MEWHWDESQQGSFETQNHAQVLKYYDVNNQIALSVDASSEGLGAVILQVGNIVAYGSRALTDCQKTYAQIEKSFWPSYTVVKNSASTHIER